MIQTKRERKSITKKCQQAETVKEQKRELELERKLRLYEREKQKNKNLSKICI